MTLSEKMQFLCLFILQSSAKTLFRWGGKINPILIAKSPNNIYAKNYSTGKYLLKLQLKMAGIWDTV